MENNKEELKRLEKKYSKYMIFVKILLLIILITLGLLAIRYGYVYSLMYKITKANHSDKAKENCKLTYSYSYKNGENNSTTVVYCRDGISVMKIEDFFAEYCIADKRYSVYDTETQKTYTVNDFDNRNFETITNWERAVAVFYLTNSSFVSNIGHEVLNNEKCITIEKSKEKNWYNRENYLLVRKEEDKYILDIKYENGVVTEQDITLPDLSKYKYNND